MYPGVEKLTSVKFGVTFTFFGAISVFNVKFGVILRYFIQNYVKLLLFYNFQYKKPQNIGYL